MRSNKEKKPRTKYTKRYKKYMRENESDNFCYCKVGIAITIYGAIGKIKHLDSAPKIISHFGCTNNILVE